MVFARVAEYLSGEQLSQPQPAPTTEHGSLHKAMSPEESRWQEKSLQSHTEDLETRPAFLHAMLAGGTGGLMGDMLMHSLDTVKTRQQGDPHMPPKYTSMGNTYYTIWRQEGVRRGLYGGVTPAFLGSFTGTTIFFGSYEWGKRMMIDSGINPSISYFTAGLFADLAASPLYVPSEVLKTRLQLQGRYKNPFFVSGYNYKSTWHALRTIVRTEGIAELFSGYKATLARDLPFSALQFAFYEQEQRLAKEWVDNKDIGLGLEIITGASAGGMAGVITCPLDVVKTRIQTQLDPALAHPKLPHQTHQQASPHGHPQHHGEIRPVAHQSGNPHTLNNAPSRHISTGGPSTSLRAPGAVTLDTESVLQGLRVIYKAEGIAGWFRGVGPRGVWTSIQSGTMLVMYQMILKWFDGHPLVADEH